MSALRRLIGLRDDRPGFVAASLALLGLLLAWPLADAYLRGLRAAGAGFGWVSPFHFNDFGAYSVAVARWYNGQGIYWSNDGSFFGTYLYPPAYVLLFVPWFELGQLSCLQGLPMAEYPVQVSGLLFEAFSVLLLWVGLQWLAGDAGLELAWYDRALALPALVGFHPLLFSAKLGQVSALVAALFCFAYVAMRRGDRADYGDPAGTNGPTEGGDPTADGDPGGLANPEGRGDDAGGYRGRAARFASGALTTLAAGIKPYYATAGAHLLRDRDRLAGAVLGGVGILALSVAVFGVGNNLDYLDVLLWGKGWGARPPAIYLWHPGYYEPLYAVGRRSPAAASALRFLLVGTVVAVSLAGRRADADRATFALGLSVYPLVAPEVYTQDFVALLVAAAVLVHVEFDRPDGRPWIPVVAVGLLAVHAYGLFLLLNLPGWLPLGRTLENAAGILQPGLWGALALFGLSLSRVAGAAGLDRFPSVGAVTDR